MKFARLAFSLFLSLCLPTLAAAAEPLPVKTCLTEVGMPDGWTSGHLAFQVFRDDQGTASAKLTQTMEGFADLTGSFEYTAEISSHPVRAGLTATQIEGSDLDDLNLAERLVVHAMLLSESPEFQGSFSAGMDLKSVRSATVYQINNATHMGLTAIVEARDENGKELGSFFGGFLVSPCK